MTLIERDIKPRDIVTADAIDDAFALDMAMGGSIQHGAAHIGISQRSRRGLSVGQNQFSRRQSAAHLQSEPSG